MKGKAHLLKDKDGNKLLPYTSPQLVQYADGKTIDDKVEELVTGYNSKVAEVNGKISEVNGKISQANSDHSTAVNDHGIAAGDHSAAGSDHNIAVSDHSVASGDHSTAASDHSTAVSDHSKAAGAENVNAAVSSDGKKIVITGRDGVSKEVAIPEGGGVSDAYTKAQTDALLEWKANSDELEDLVTKVGDIEEVVDKDNDNTSFKVVDSNENVVATIDSDGLKSVALRYKNTDGDIVDVEDKFEDLEDAIEEVSEKSVDGVLGLYEDKLYITDNSGNVLASFTNDGIKVVNLPDNLKDVIDDIPTNIGKYLWNGEEFFVVGDSFCAGLSKDNWIGTLKELMGATFDDVRNKQHISIGGTTTVQGDFQAGQIRLRTLASELQSEGIEPKHIIFENVNDITQATNTFSVSSIDDEPFMMSGNFINTSVAAQDDEESAISYFNANIGTLLNGKTAHHGDVFKMPYKTLGVTLYISGTPTTSGVLSIKLYGRDAVNCQISSGASIQDVLDKILEYNFPFYDDVQNGENGVSFIPTNPSTANTIADKTAEQIVDASFSGQGLTLSVVKDNNAVTSVPLGFIAHDTSKWTDANKWVKLSNISYYSVLKGLVEYATSKFRDCEVIMMIAPRLGFAIAESGYTHTYTDGSPNQTAFIARKEVTSGKLTKIWKDVSELYGVKYVDVANEWGVNCANYSTFYNSGDVHPKKKGYERMGQVMYRNLK